MSDKQCICSGQKVFKKVIDIINSILASVACFMATVACCMSDQTFF